jgi:5-methyltetrahydropteroyltriglutamate--homocysteine methyltransferase
MPEFCRINPIFPAEHVGSLLRPPALRAAFRKFQAKKIDAAAFRRAQDDAIREAVTLQVSLGMRAITDGEFRRASYWSHFVEAVDGFGVGEARFTFHDARKRETPFLAPKVTGTVKRTRPISGHEFDFLRGLGQGFPKITLPSPPTLHFWAGPAPLKAAGYASEDAFFSDIVGVYREEISDLALRGARYIQLDEVPLAMLCDERLRTRIKRQGDDPDRLVDRYVELINAAVKFRPRQVTLGIHLCRGNYQGKWLSEGSYRAVAERMFNGIAADAFFLEYDTPRAGDFQPLAAVPGGKMIVLGLVSSKSRQMESRASLLRRIEQAAQYIPLGRLCLSPQCGFASAVSGNPITPQVQSAKLKLVRQIADEVWGER